MKKNERIIKYGIISLLGILLMNPLHVNAAKAWISNNGTTDNSTLYNTGEAYQDFYVTVQDGNATYDAYCLDHGNALDGGDNPSDVSCQSVTDTKVAAGFAYILNAPVGHNVKQMALREFARIHNLSKSADYIVSSPLLSQIQSLVSEANNATVNNNQATANLSFTKISGNGAEVTYSVTSSVPLDKVDFVCKSGCEIKNKQWDKTSGTITVAATNNGCSFTINAFYNSAGVRFCTAASIIQNVIYYSDVVSQNENASQTNATQTFTGSIDPSTGGNYYEKYCKNNDNDKCNEKTTLEKKDYCDVSGNEMKITAPKNAKYCILNSNDDAGNTYQDTSTVKKNNPYCAVYCKEDYVMSLPGAKYSDSGRYFELENTVVNATRTCYATNADNDPEKGVNINKYLSDIKKAQEDLRDAYNAYIKAKHEAELAKSAMPHYGTNCDNKSAGIFWEIDSKSYNDGIALTNYNKDTGEYQVKYGASIQTDYHKWGSEGYTATVPDKNSPNGTKCVNQSHDYGSYDPEGNLNTARSNLNTAENHLKEVINNMEDCYNWKNNLCLNPEVVFDYNEQYSGDINYELVSGGGTIVGEDATYKTGSKDGNTPIDNEYTTSGGSTLENPAYVNCTEEGCKTQTTEKGISTNSKALYYRKIEVTGTAEYANTQEFQTNYPHGTIDTIPEGAEVHKNYSYLGAVFPVALNTKTGVYKWTLNFSNLGMYNDEPSCKNGRLDDVLATIPENASAGVEYVCVYVVDCDDCDYECVGDYCYHDEEPKCPECDVYCTNCIFDGDGFVFNYKVASVNDLNPNERTMGSNWTSEKGQKALEAIEAAAETIYEQPQYVITLNPNNMKEIRDYNKETDTYVAKDLDYHTKDEIPNAYGTSAFLRDEKNQKKFFNEIKLNDSWELWTSVDKANHVGPAYK